MNIKRHITILGQGKNWISLINHLDRNVAFNNGVWKWDYKTFGLKIIKNSVEANGTKGTDLGLVFFEYPDHIMEDHVADLRNNGSDFLLMWPATLDKKDHQCQACSSRQKTSNFFLSTRPNWNNILNQV